MATLAPPALAAFTHPCASRKERQEYFFDGTDYLILFAPGFSLRSSRHCAFALYIVSILPASRTGYE